MDEEVSAKTIKKTQDLLGSVIKKPPLQEKLLKKPPFRFLHDVIHNVIKATKFLDGLYTQEELTSENIKDKESKIAFLQKAIDALGILTGSALSVRPSKIVSGHEPDKTNEFLQVLAKAAAKKQDSTEAVKKVLAGEKPSAPTKSDKKDASKKKELSKTPKKPESERKSRKAGAEEAVNNEKKSTSSVPKEKEKSSSSGKSSKTAKTSSSREHRSKSREPDADKKSGSVQESSSTAQEGNTERPKTSSRKKSSREQKEPTEVVSSELTNGTEKLEQRETFITEEKSGLDLQTTNHSAAQDEVVAKRPRSTKRSSHKEQTTESSTDELQDKELTLNTDEMTLQVNNLAVHESVSSATAEVERPLSRSTLRSSRPRSSRPAAPRIRKREGSAESTPAARVATAKPVENVILDTNGDKNEDGKDDEFVIIDAAVEPVLAKVDTPSSEQLPEAEQGSLVKQILEAKKELEQGSQRPTTGQTTAAMPITPSKSQGQDKMDTLRQHIQAVSRGALPLGRLLDLLSEDLDSMNAELNSWKEEHARNLQAYSSEQSMTDSILEPLRQNLEELDQRIGDQLETISATKATIFSNAERLEKMLAAANLGR